MLYNVGSIVGYKLHSQDGDIGKVEEFYFDDLHWTIRYLVANSGNWLTGRQVLLSPYALIAIHADDQNVVVNLTKKQIENSPDLSSDKPISRQFELAYYDYFGWPTYWSGEYLWGSYAAYPYLVRDREKWPQPDSQSAGWDPHLRSTHAVRGHVIHATDGEIGHVVDFILDDETWAIRYLVVDTANWWPGGKVLISPKWIDKVSWSERAVHVIHSRESIRQSPAYTGQQLLTRPYEGQLHDHYQSQRYWSEQ